MYSSVKVEARKYLLLDILSSNLYSPTQIKDRLLSNQTQTIGHEVVGLTIAFYLVYATYESNLLGILISLLLNPSMTFLFFPMIEEVHIEHLATVLEFWMLEVNFSNSRTFDERCRCESSGVLLFPRKSSQFDCAFVNHS